MSETNLNVRLQHASKTEEEWRLSNPIAKNGELMFSSDVNKIKVGNGVAKWDELEYTSADIRGLLASVAELNNTRDTRSNIQQQLDNKSDLPEYDTYTIPTTNWTHDSYHGYPYYYDIPVEGVTASDRAEISLTWASVDIAKKCNLCTVTETLKDTIRIRAEKIPSGSMPVEYWIEKSVPDAVKNIEEQSSIVSDIQSRTPHAATIEEYYNKQRTGKIYQTKIWRFATNPTSTGVKLMDNAGLKFKPSTDTVEGEDDYLNGQHPMFEWVNCNYVRNKDGSPKLVATEYDENYTTTGSVDVGAMQMSFYWSVEPNDEEGYDLWTVSDMQHSMRTDVHLKPWSECVKANGTVLSYCIGSKYFSGIASDGLLRSQPNLQLARAQSYNNMMTNYPKKGTGYHGAGAERNTFQIIFIIIKGATKHSQSLFYGCASHNFQYSASVQRSTKDVYFPVTNSQANNIVVGTYVSVGYAHKTSDTAVSLDRGYAEPHIYADSVRITKIETLDSNNKAVYLDIPASKGFTTTTYKYSDTLTAPITMTSMMSWSGTTDSVKGRHDGSKTSNTNGRFPYRIQGREYGIGAYVVASDMVIVFNTDHSKDIYVCPKGVTRSNAVATVKSTYTNIGTIPVKADGSGDYYIGDIGIDTTTGGWYPKSVGGNSTQGCADYVYGGGAPAADTTREALMCGYLGLGAGAGFSFLNCRFRLGDAGWYYAAAD